MKPLQQNIFCFYYRCPFFGEDLQSGDRHFGNVSKRFGFFEKQVFVRTMIHTAHLNTSSQL